MNNSKFITGRSSIGDWLSHPTGGPLLRNLLAQAGQDESVLAPTRNLPLEQLVSLSQGQMSQATIDDLVARANGGAMPDASDEQAAEWTETVVPDRFSGQTVIITGAASGIGRATASRVAREGGRVVAVDISAEQLKVFAAAHADFDVVAVVGDITANDDVETIVTAAQGRIDALANVAGIMDDMTPLHEVSDAVWSRVWAVNVSALALIPPIAQPAQLAASITFLLSNDATNINGAILPSDSGWSVQ